MKALLSSISHFADDRAMRRRMKRRKGEEEEGRRRRGWRRLLFEGAGPAEELQPIILPRE